jgi:hypothetical protein
MSIFGEQKDVDQLLMPYLNRTSLFSMRRTCKYYNNLITPMLFISIGNYLETLPRGLVFHYECSDNNRFFVLYHIVIHSSTEYVLYGSLHDIVDITYLALNSEPDCNIELFCDECSFDPIKHEIKGEDNGYGETFRLVPLYKMAVLTKVFQSQFKGTKVPWFIQFPIEMVQTILQTKVKIWHDFMCQGWQENGYGLTCEDFTYDDSASIWGENEAMYISRKDFHRIALDLGIHNKLIPL